jgi:hypothetical protein
MPALDVVDQDVVDPTPIPTPITDTDTDTVVSEAGDSHAERAG